MAQPHDLQSGPTPNQVLGIALICAVVGLVLGLTVNGYQHATGVPWRPAGAAGPTAARLSAVKDSVAVVQSLATIGGILAAGYLFFWRRRPYPRLGVTQRVEHHALTPETVWLRVQASVENRGEQIVRLGQATTVVLRILPLDPAIAAHAVPRSRVLHRDPVRGTEKPHIRWGVYDEWSNGPGAVEVEPGETTTFELDFLVDAGLKLVQVYTFINNPKKPDPAYGWPVDTVYSLEKPLKAGAGGDPSG